MIVFSFDFGANLAPFWEDFQPPGGVWGALGGLLARLGELLNSLGGTLAHLGAVLAYLGGVLGRLGGLLGPQNPPDPLGPTTVADTQRPLRRVIRKD